MKDGLQRVLDLLDMLDEKGIHYQLDQARAGALHVFFTVVGARVEVEFTPKGMTYRLFEGSEDVHTDMTALLSQVERAGAN